MVQVSNTKLENTDIMLKYSYTIINSYIGMHYAVIKGSN